VIKLILSAIARVAKQKNPNNMMLHMVIKCTMCCIWCFEKTVQYITYFGMIFVAIEGKTYCSACWATFQVWTHYPSQVTVNKLVAKILSLVISVSIPVGCGFICFLWVDGDDGHEPIWAAVAAGILSAMIASCITDVFRCAIDTIFICCFTDMERKEGSMHMPKSLQKGFDVEKSKLEKDRRATVGKEPILKKGTSTANPADVELTST